MSQSKQQQQTASTAAAGAPLRSESQSLFNIYYLGNTVVDRRCSSSVMPWIIEEMKIKAAKMRFLWLTPGMDRVTYVADSGQELFSHTYGSILQCCIAIDGISFAYISRREKDNKYLCHVFQALTYEEASLIMSKFKKHAKEEVSVGSTISRSATAPTDLKKSSGLIFAPPPSQPTAAASSKSSRGTSGEDTMVCEYQLEYVGKFDVPSPATSSETQVETVDNIVAKLRENQKNGGGPGQPKVKPKRRSFTAMFKNIGKQSTSGGKDSDSVDGMAASNSASSLMDNEEEEGLTFSANGHSESCSSLRSQEEGEGEGSSTDVSVVVTAPSPEEVLTPPTDVHRSVSQTEGGEVGTAVTNGSDKEAGSSPSLSQLGREEGKVEKGEENGVDEAKGATSNGVMETAGPQSSQNGEEMDNGEGKKAEETFVRTYSESFDTLPELATLKNTYAFQALSQNQNQKVKLVFSGLTVAMLSEPGGEQLLNLHVRNISCCAQGSKENEYVGFTSREGRGSKGGYSCHLLLAQNKKQGARVLESFRAAFGHALSVAMPAALCDSCPLKQLHQLCRTLEGVSTQVAQSRIQECLSTLSEADFSRIMKQYKSSEHATQEFTQIVTLVALLRQHFQRQQESHTHRGLGTGSGLDERSLKPKLPALARAKNALASSINNLPTKKNGVKSRKDSETAVDDRASQSLNLPVHSPIFTRKTKLDELMAPIPLSPSTEKEKKMESRLAPRLRERSWSDRMQKRKVREINISNGESDSAKKNDEAKESGGEKKERRKTPPPPLVARKEQVLNRRPRSPSPLATSPPATSQKKFESITTTPRRTPRRGWRGNRTSRTPPAQMVSTPSTDHQPRLGHRRSTSYTCRAEIFESVHTPERRGSYDVLEEFEIIEPSVIDQLGTSWQSPEERKKKKRLEKEEDERRSPRSKARRRWRNAIKQQIMLNQMEKKNEIVKQASSDADLKRLKLCYTDPHFKSHEAKCTEIWNRILLSEQSEARTDIMKALILGVPPKKRGEAWHFLCGQYQANSAVEHDFQPSLATRDGFMQLCEERTPYEHSIYVDIGRTFPSHPYFASSLKHGGQVTLRRVLHAYAVVDQEIGYCQGISFVAGMILMHCKDELASFKYLHMLMQLYNYREVYASELTNLQMKLYQLSRLLYEINPNLYYLLKENEVTPFFYAAPWFLTLFASQFPIAFCARVLDLLFYEGPNVVFKIALALLNIHEENLLECHNMETTCAFLKNKLPDIVLNKMPTIFEEAMRIDLGNRLATFETEFEVMSELSQNAFRSDIHVNDLESVNGVLRRQNSALIEQLAICHGSIRRLEGMVVGLQEQLEEQKQSFAKLEERLTNRASHSTADVSSKIEQTADTQPT